MLLLYGTADSGDMWERHNGADVDSFRHVVATCVIMPVAEEIAHHWVGLTVMCRVMPTIWARLLSSVIFGMIHNLEGDYYGDASRRVCTAVGSAILEQRLFLRYGLAASIAAHVTRNSLVGIVTDNNFSWDPWDERTSEKYYMRWLYVALPLWCISVFLNTVLTYHATRSVAVAVLVAVGFAVASKMYFPDVKPSPRPDRNYLAGHRDLTEEEYASEARDATDEALTCLVETDEYRAWVVAHVTRLSARGAEVIRLAKNRLGTGCEAIPRDGAACLILVPARAGEPRLLKTMTADGALVLGRAYSDGDANAPANYFAACTSAKSKISRSLVRVEVKDGTITVSNLVPKATQRVLVNGVEVKQGEDSDADDDGARVSLVWMGDAEKLYIVRDVLPNTSYTIDARIRHESVTSDMGRVDVSVNGHEVLQGVRFCYRPLSCIHLYNYCVGTSTIGRIDIRYEKAAPNQVWAGEHHGIG